MTRVAAYPEYKASGTKWLGDVPEHWRISPLGQYFRERKGTVSDADFAALSVTKQGIVPQLETAAKTDNGDSRKLVLTGDFAINSRSDRKGSSGVSPLKGSVSLITTVITPHGLEAQYVHHLLRSEPFQEEYYRFGNGIVADLWSTRYAQMKSISLAVPPLEEQLQIAEYLDRETGQIDALITKQEQLVETLTERRQAMIAQAVTRGLEPDVELRDSGNDWVGFIPAHWSHAVLKRSWQVLDCKHVTADFVDEGIPLASIREVQSHFVDLSSAKRTTPEFYAQLVEGDRRPFPGDLLFSRNATVGKVCQIPMLSERFAMGQDVCLLRATTLQVSAPYLQHVLQSPVVTAQMEAMMVGSTFKRLNVEQIRVFAIPIPPRAEQDEIVHFLDVDTLKTDALIAKARQVVEVLQERRQALISAAVTGKIDVRGL